MVAPGGLGAERGGRVDPDDVRMGERGQQGLQADTGPDEEVVGAQPRADRSWRRYLHQARWESHQ
ncbi:hypothetical protein CFP66_40325 [Pseudonocardia sp. MH-G8]|nr:hypothetical protein CFP66_40325 [Pseudonocardia sp. MH-G8]